MKSSAGAPDIFFEKKSPMGTRASSEIFISSTERVEDSSSQQVVKEFLDALNNLKELCGSGKVSDKDLELIKNELKKLILDMANNNKTVNGTIKLLSGLFG